MAGHDLGIGWLLLTFVAVALGLLLVYLLFSGIHRAFQHVGFTRGQASLILLGSLIGGMINIPVWVTPNGWIVGVNVGGALVPLAVTWLLLRRFPELWREALTGILFVTLTTYLVTSATPEGIVSYFPFYLLPIAVAAAFAMLAFWRDAGYSAPLAYVSGTLGALIGADVLRLGEFLAQAPPEAGRMASIGGASVYDMVFLTGVLAVLLDLLFFRRFQREQPAGMIEYSEGVVFTPSTPYHVLNGPVQLHQAPRPARAAAASTPKAPQSPQDRHRQWEEEMRRRAQQRMAAQNR